MSYGGRPSSFFGHEVIAEHLLFIVLFLIFYYMNNFIEGNFRKKPKIL